MATPVSPDDEPPVQAVQLLELVDRQRDALIGGDLSGLAQPAITGHQVHASPNGSTVIAIDLADAVRDALPPDHRHLDLFLLEPDSRLGTHYHRHASALIHIISGTGQAEIDGRRIAFAPGDKLRFPAGSRHDVLSGSAPVLFASFQDNPIIQSDGSLDYHVD